MKLMYRKGQAGDTLIEVLFAFAVLSLVIVGALSIMSQGTTSTERSLEITLVREEVDSQATALRFLHDAYVAKYQPGAVYPAGSAAQQWVNMTHDINLRSTTPSKLADCTRPDGSFILNPVTAHYEGMNTKLAASKTFAQLTYDSSGALSESDGIWIEGIRPANPGSDATSYIDFHINACWDAPGSGPSMTIGTIVRLYVPTS